MYKEHKKNTKRKPYNMKKMTGDFGQQYSRFFKLSSTCNS